MFGRLYPLAMLISVTILFALGVYLIDKHGKWRYIRAGIGLVAAVVFVIVVMGAALAIAFNIWEQLSDRNKLAALIVGLTAILWSGVVLYERLFPRPSATDRLLKDRS